MFWLACLRNRAKKRLPSNSLLSQFTVASLHLLQPHTRIPLARGGQSIWSAEARRFTKLLSSSFASLRGFVIQTLHLLQPHTRIPLARRAIHLPSLASAFLLSIITVKSLAISSRLLPDSHPVEQVAATWSNGCGPNRESCVTNQKNAPRIITSTISSTALGNIIR